jgi:signal transduction histidine kinase
LKRLYLQLYLTVVVSLLAFAMTAGYLWRTLVQAAPPPPAFDLIADVVHGVLPPPDAPLAAQQAALERLSAGGRIPMTLYGADGERTAFVGDPIERPADPHDRRWWHEGHIFTLPLDDGRLLAARPPPPPPHRPPRPYAPLGFFLTLCLVAAAVAVGAYPVVRHLTRRLERLQASADAWGAGNLGARVNVEGRDEVAAVARSFNHAAERVERLVSAHKTLLANASHELRSPLARIRMAAGMLGHDAKPEVRQGLDRDIAELDALIDEVLLASRLDAVREPVRDDVDLLGLSAEECARAGVALDGEPITLTGDARLLRRLVRNLLDNARRHGGGAVRVALVRAGANARLEVCDRGPGVPEAARERVFEPFYRLPGLHEGEGGAGLGLALVKQIAERHGGTVRCLANEGGGACFEVLLPLGR